MPGCHSPEQKVDAAAVNVAEAKNDLTNAQEDYAKEIENFRKESNEKILANEKIIADSKLKMVNEKKESREAYNKKIEALEVRNSAMRKRMDDYHEDGNDNWHSFKTEFNHDMDELGHSLKDFTVNNKN